MLTLPVLQSNGLLANIILVVHFAWAAWMISGFVLALLGFRWPRLWEWKVFRITHLLGLLGTSTTPFWADGICPLTEWEWQLRSTSAASSGNAGSESFIIQWMRDVLFLDIDPLILSLTTGAIALVTVILFFVRPPWRSYTRIESKHNSATDP
jgi:hypothetical protein